jgi:hypothetical protein
MIPRVLKFIYYLMIVSAFCANMIVVSHTTTLSVLGAGFALRGPDGSMVTATDGLYDERKSVLFSFGLGLACTVGSLIMCVWLVLHWEAALICMLITCFTCFKIFQNYRRVVRRFRLWWKRDCQLWWRILWSSCDPGRSKWFANTDEYWQVASRNPKMPAMGPTFQMEMTMMTVATIRVSC